MRRGAKLGQHFLNAQWVARDLVKSVHLQPDEPVLEIGPGRGALTKELLAQSARVVAIEKDTNLIPVLESAFKNELSSGMLTIIEGDVRDFSPETLGTSYAIAANIPYYITGEIIRHFLTAAKQPRAMALLIQKEVAERIVARDGKESILSLSVKAYGTPSIVAKVPAGCFNPPPSVDSAILLVKDISRDYFDTINEEDFFKVVRAGFSSKRKMLAGNLKPLFPNSQNMLKEAGVSEKVRAEDVRMGEWKKLVEKLAD
ncbi:MAG: 16S rRNA (adenine(1518)-N(6)/adenine(1519)-N(6))-dimethyltransferase RsmA [Minisyncoccia bacterium]